MSRLDLLPYLRGAPALTALVGVAPTADEVIALARGTVSGPETINYRTHAPDAHGLFAPDIFGPFRDDKEQLPHSTDDTPTPPLPFGRISLAAPVLHPILVRTSIDAVAARAGLTPEDITALADRADSHPMEATAALAESCPELVIVQLPVLAASLRPMVRAPGSSDGETRWLTSELNDHYRRVINRSNRCARLAELKAPEVILRNELRMLFDSVDSLFDNAHRDTPIVGVDARPLAALDDLFHTFGGWSSIAELDRRVAADSSALASPLPARLRCAHAVLYAMGVDLRPRATTVSGAGGSTPPTPPTPTGGGPVPVPY
jgi:DNA-directed RNA polymerase beta' subunit